MRPIHYASIIAGILAGYVLARFYPQLGDMAMLPKA